MNRIILLQIIFTIDELQKEKFVKGFQYIGNVLKIIYDDDTLERIYMPYNKHQAIQERDYRRLKDER